MKTLTRLRLINWHRFQNETIEFQDAVLLSGENGAGKSTILDAIQYVITCSKANFNKAAHQEKGERNLTGYIRCKTGREDRPFERTGELSAHIALEFFDQARNAPFILGVVMDSSTEDQEPKVAWYLMEKQTLSDRFFFMGKKVKSISTFRQTNQREIKQFVTTVGEAKKLVLQRFGRIEDKFFTLIPKALAFKPIHEIRDFVYSYVLDKKEVNIDALRENVRSYQDLLRLLNDVRQRSEELTGILSYVSEIRRIRKNDAFQEYYIRAAEKDLLTEEIRGVESELRQLELGIRALESKKDALRSEKDEKEGIIRNLQSELDHDEEYKALKELERRENELKLQLEAAKRDVSELKTKARAALSEIGEILRFCPEKIFSEYQERLGGMEKEEDLTSLQMCLDEVLRKKMSLNNETQQKIASVNQELFIRQRELQETEAKIASLEKKKLLYPEGVELLKRKIESQFSAAGRTGEVRVLCELLEIKDSSWRNAVEGYLNTQRFYLIVEPDDFDLALSVYEKLRAEKKVYGAGLVNTGKLDEYDTCPEGSLAEVVSAKSIWAGRYVNMVLGKVHRCDSYQDLKNWPVSVTRQCMRYQNHVASAIRPEIYEIPYIGEEAYKKQLEKAREQKAELEKEIAVKKEELSRKEKLSELLSRQSDMEVKYRLGALMEQRNIKEALTKCREDMRALPAGDTLIQKRMRLQAFENERKKLEDRIENCLVEIGQSRNQIVIAEKRKEELRTEAEEAESVLRLLEVRLSGDAESILAEYRRLRSQKSAEEIRNNYQRSRKANETLVETAKGKMSSAMADYNAAHNFGAPPTEAGIPQYEAESDKLRNSEILSYEEKVRTARDSAESEFREQFLARLQENIRKAQTEFKELNKALSGISFSGEHYEFTHAPGKSLKKYYDMIMDDFNLMGGESIFSGIFSETHKEVIEELFDKLVLDGEEAAKTLDQYTDYRTYMDYDLRITGQNGSSMLYSKVSREKSGGETQTPFYIIVAASFMQLYKGSLNNDSIGLVMLDEAFNNMDDERIKGILEFMTGKDLQLIISAPPEKIQYIGPSVDKVLLVLSDGKESYVEDFTRETVR